MVGLLFQTFSTRAKYVRMWHVGWRLKITFYRSREDTLLFYVIQEELNSISKTVTEQHVLLQKSTIRAVTSRRMVGTFL